MGGLPSTAHSALAREFGVNKDRYQVHPLVETDYVALNTTTGRTFSEMKLRKAANFAIDRPAMLRVRGAFSGKATDQILPPGMGGFQDGSIYPLTGADFARAKHLAGGSCKHVNLWTANTTQGQNLGQVFKYDLEQIGCKVDVRLFAGFQIYTAAGARGADFDAALVGWNQDYPDPYDFLDVLLNGKNIRAQNNNNLAYFNVPAVNRKLAAANRLTGEARYHRYGRLDVEITRDYAPWASYDNRNERELVSARVGGYVFQPANASADLNTFFLR
jgi:peptide/nickel transport system substrate-binding protein